MTRIMHDGSALKWNDYAHMAVNFATGCSNWDYACREFCWARKMAKRIAAMEAARDVGKQGTYSRVEVVTAPGPYTPGDPFHPALHVDAMNVADRKLDGAKTSKRVALNFMSDICSAGDWLVFDEVGDPCPHMDSAGVQDTVRCFCDRHPRHTFLVLTKRPEALISPWPANVHVGTSASWMESALKRGCDLSKVDCGVRWLSLEPWNDATMHSVSEYADMLAACQIGWVVIGGWSGKKDMAPESIASAKQIVAACTDVGLPVFVKENLQDATHWFWPQELPK